MKKRFFQLVLTAVLSVSCVATGVNVSAAPLSSEGYSIEKVSHPERGAGETDGILSFDAMGEESNRNQSYVWSCVEHGNYIYLGTCWNPISGIYYRNLKNNLTKLFQNRGDENPAQKAGTVATNILNVVYNGNFPDGATSTNGTPCIMRVNKYTYETEVVYVEKESSAFVNWNGYRMAVEYNGKLYFACAGFPTSRLLQIDPETNETKVVMQKTAENSGFPTESADSPLWMASFSYLWLPTAQIQTTCSHPVHSFHRHTRMRSKQWPKKTYVTKTITHVCRVYVFFPLQIQKT